MTQMSSGISIKLEDLRKIKIQATEVSWLLRVCKFFWRFHTTCWQLWENSCSYMLLRDTSADGWCGALRWTGGDTTAEKTHLVPRTVISLNSLRPWPTDDESWRHASELISHTRKSDYAPQTSLDWWTCNTVVMSRCTGASSLSDLHSNPSWDYKRHHEREFESF